MVMELVNILQAVVIGSMSMLMVSVAREERKVTVAARPPAPR